jgi:hypothetical protein
MFEVSQYNQLRSIEKSFLCHKFLLNISDIFRQFCNFVQDLLNILSQLKYAPGYNEDIALRRNCTDELNTKAATISIAVG